VKVQACGDIEPSKMTRSAVRDETARHSVLVLTPIATAT